MSAIVSLIVKSGRETATLEQGMTKAVQVSVNTMRKTETDARRGLGNVKSSATEAGS